MAHPPSGSPGKGQEQLDLESELPTERGYALDLERCQIQAEMVEPNSGLQVRVGVCSPGRLDYSLEYLLACGASVLSAATTFLFTRFTEIPESTELLITGSVGAVTLIGALAWVALRKKP